MKTETKVGLGVLAVAAAVAIHEYLQWFKKGWQETDLLAPQNPPPPSGYPQYPA